MNKENLANKIAKELNQLSGLLDKADEARIINPDEAETWDSDTLATLATNCRKILEILEDKKDPKNKDPWGQSMVLEEGLCSLVDEYHEGNGEDNDYGK